MAKKNASRSASRETPAAASAPPAQPRTRRLRPVIALAGVAAALGLTATAIMVSKDDAPPAAPPPAAPKAAAAPSAAPGTTAPVAVDQSAAPHDAPGTTRPNTELQTMEVNKAVMVTVELDYGGKPPTIAEAIKDIERHYEPDDKQGRTFAILDAYGETTPQGLLHMSMHVSSEKTGMGSLTFRRTGETLWRSRIVAGEPSPSGMAGKNLRITLDDGKGNARLLDGSKGPTNVLDAVVNDLHVPVRDFWPDGAEREVTFFYSACGCPVHVQAKRVGDRVVRTSEMPVIFPDDPAVAATIGRLMGWA